MSNEARRPTPSLAAGPDVTTLEVQLRVNKILIDKMEALANINPIKPATEWGKGYAACTLDVACGAKVVLEEVRALPPPAAPLEGKEKGPGRECWAYFYTTEGAPAAPVYWSMEAPKEIQDERGIWALMVEAPGEKGKEEGGLAATLPEASPRVERVQFTRFDEGLHPECDNAEYLEYETRKNTLTSEGVIISYGYRRVWPNGRYEWIKKAEAKGGAA